MKTNSSHHARDALARVFRAYDAFCESQSADGLFHLLECLHSANDRLKLDGHSLIAEPEFLALKCLRNYSHHKDELKDRLRILPAKNLSVSTDLLLMCLVPQDVVDRAVEGVAPKHREQARESCDAVFKWYGRIVNINPAVFNVLVKVALVVERANYDLSECEAFGRLWQQIEMERARGFSHFVTGDLYTHAGSVDDLVSRIMQ